MKCVLYDFLVLLWFYNRIIIILKSYKFLNVYIYFLVFFLIYSIFIKFLYFKDLVENRDRYGYFNMCCFKWGGILEYVKE